MASHHLLQLLLLPRRRRGVRVEVLRGGREDGGTEEEVCGGVVGTSPAGERRKPRDGEGEANGEERR